MSLDLHHAVRRAYREAMTNGGTPKKAFDAASNLVSANAPGLAPPAARRLAAQMLCWEPDPPIVPAKG